MDVVNTGGLAGSEVVQLYLTFPQTAGEPPRQLRGFHKLHLGPEERKGALFVLTRMDLSVWSAEKGAFEAVPGSFQVHVGSSATDLRLHETFHLDL